MYICYTCVHIVCVAPDLTESVLMDTTEFYYLNQKNRQKNKDKLYAAYSVLVHSM